MITFTEVMRSHGSPLPLSYYTQTTLDEDEDHTPRATVPVNPNKTRLQHRTFFESVLHDDDLAIAITFLLSGVDIHTVRGEDGLSALHIAAAGTAHIPLLPHLSAILAGRAGGVQIDVPCHNPHMLHFLIENGIDVNTATARDGLTALMIAAAMQNTVAMRVLLAHGASLTQCDRNGRSCLFYAAVHPPVLQAVCAWVAGGRDMVRAQAEREGLLHEVSLICRNPFVALFLVEQLGMDVHACMTAAHQERQLQLQHEYAAAGEGGARVNAERGSGHSPGRSTFSGATSGYAARTRDTDAARDESATVFVSRAHRGYTPLHCAVVAGAVSVVKALLMKGADYAAAAQDDSQPNSAAAVTPLSLAASIQYNVTTWHESDRIACESARVGDGVGGDVRDCALYRIDHARVYRLLRDFAAHRGRSAHERAATLLQRESSDVLTALDVRHAADANLSTLAAASWPLGALARMRIRLRGHLHTSALTQLYLLLIDVVLPNLLLYGCCVWRLSDMVTQAMVCVMLCHHLVLVCRPRGREGGWWATRGQSVVAWNLTLLGMLTWQAILTFGPSNAHGNGINAKTHVVARLSSSNPLLSPAATAEAVAPAGETDGTWAGQLADRVLSWHGMQMILCMAVWVSMGCVTTMRRSYTVDSSDGQRREIYDLLATRWHSGGPPSIPPPVVHIDGSRAGGDQGPIAVEEESLDRWRADDADSLAALCSVPSKDSPRMDLSSVDWVTMVHKPLRAQRCAWVQRVVLRYDHYAHHLQRCIGAHNHWCFVLAHIALLAHLLALYLTAPYVADPSWQQAPQDAYSAVGRFVQLHGLYTLPVWGGCVACAVVLRQLRAIMRGLTLFDLAHARGASRVYCVTASDGLVHSIVDHGPVLNLLYFLVSPLHRGGGSAAALSQRDYAAPVMSSYMQCKMNAMQPSPCGAAERAGCCGGAAGGGGDAAVACTAADARVPRSTTAAATSHATNDNTQARDAASSGLVSSCASSSSALAESSSAATLAQCARTKPLMSLAQAIFQNMVREGSDECALTRSSQSGAAGGASEQTQREWDEAVLEARAMYQFFAQAKRNAVGVTCAPHQKDLVDDLDVGAAAGGGAAADAGRVGVVPAKVAGGSVQPQQYSHAQSHALLAGEETAGHGAMMHNRNSHGGEADSELAALLPVHLTHAGKYK